MPNPLVAVTGGSAVLGLIGASKAASASKKASQQQAQSAQAALDQNAQFYNTARSDLAPYREAGVGALNTLSGLISPPSAPTYAGPSSLPAGAMSWDQWQNRYLSNWGLPSVPPERQAELRRDYETYLSGFAPAPAPTPATAPPQESLLAPIPTELPPSLLPASVLEANAVANPNAPTDLTAPIPTEFNYQPFNFTKEPGYDFRLSEGNKGIDRAAASRGMYDSGATLKALTRFNQDYASNEYGKSFDRYNTNRNFDYGNFADTFSRNAANRDFAYGANFDKYNQTAANKDRPFNYLTTLAGIGANATGAGVNAGANYAGSNANLITGAGNARAAGTVGAANAWQSGLGNIQSGLTDYATLKMLTGSPSAVSSRSYRPIGL